MASIPSRHHRSLPPLLVLLGLVAGGWAATVDVSTAGQLLTAVNQGAAGDTIRIKAGTYLLPSTLQPKANMVITGAGASSTILRNASTWVPTLAGLPDNAVDAASAVRNAYLIDLAGNDGIRISGLTLDGSDQLHGAILGNNADSLDLSRLVVKRFVWCGIRTWSMGDSAIHDSEFIDAGGKHDGTTGGCLYLTWAADSQIYNNRMTRSTASTRPVFGIKGRQAKRCRMFCNTILVGFSMEWPFENDEDNEIDHNYMTGTVSIPKHAGGPVPASGVTFRIHHNYFTSSYALEWARNGTEVDHNLFDFDTAKDGGNLISCWTPDAAGPTRFHDNLIKNPGRGVFWSQEVFNNFQFYNNHVIANQTVTPRREGLFGLNTRTDFSTIVIKDNIIECVGLARPLMRNTASYGAVIQNNTLTNVSDAASYPNPSTSAKRGPLAPLRYVCGVNGEYVVDQWTVSKTGGSGSITREYWTGLTGTTISSIPLLSPPTGATVLKSLEAPINWTNNYGTRLRGYITAPSTGSYTFWIAADDRGELWLSTSDQPADKRLIASVTAYTGSRQWTKYSSQKSVAVSLVAGRKYYLEVLHKENSGSDNLAVGWARPGQATSAPSEVVPGTVLSPALPLSELDPPMPAGNG